MKLPPIPRPPFGEKTEKKNFPLHVSEVQKTKIVEIWMATGIFATDIVSKGISGIENIEELPSSEGPFSELFTLKVESETILKLDEIAQKNNCSRAEIVRKIIDRTINLWEQEKENLIKVDCPFSKVFRSTWTPFGS